MAIGVGSLITVASIGFASLILQKILDVSGQQQFSQYVGILGIAGCALTIINVIAQVLTALKGLA